MKVLKKCTFCANPKPFNVNCRESKRRHRNNTKFKCNMPKGYQGGQTKYANDADRKRAKYD